MLSKQLTVLKFNQMKAKLVFKYNAYHKFIMIKKTCNLFGVFFKYCEFNVDLFLQSVHINLNMNISEVYFLQHIKPKYYV